MLFNW